MPKSLQKKSCQSSDNPPKNFASRMDFCDSARQDSIFKSWADFFLNGFQENFIVHLPLCLRYKGH